MSRRQGDRCKWVGKEMDGMQVDRYRQHLGLQEEEIGRMTTLMSGQRKQIVLGPLDLECDTVGLWVHLKFSTTDPRWWIAVSSCDEMCMEKLHNP